MTADYKPIIDQIQSLVGADTPGEALEKVRAMVVGVPGDEPPDNQREVLVCTEESGFFLSWYSRNLNWWYFYDDNGLSHPCYEVERWWELPPAPEVIK